ncbi:MAG: YfiR family protein [Candidatus Aminicenantes bacterium]|nr:YfiR family protein [Candidatus Aminicenantes bacterium]
MKFAWWHKFLRSVFLFLFLIFLTTLLPLYPSTVNYVDFTDIQYYLNPAREFDLFKKVLTFERNWKSRVSEKLVIAIIYQSSYSLSTWAMEDWHKLYENLPETDKQLEHIPIALVTIDLDSTTPLENELRENRVNFVYLTPLEASKSQKLIKSVKDLCTKLKIATFTAIPEYLDYGLAVCFKLQDSKVQILLNLEASKAQGLSFSSQFLRLTSLRGKNG